MNRNVPIAKPAKPSDEGGLLETIKVVIQALAIALVIRTLLFQPFNIPSGSMIPTLLIGDYVFVSKYSYGYSNYSIPFGPNWFSGRILGADPKRGDVVVFKLPRDNETDYIKRVIGLPGDHIVIGGDKVSVNGQTLTEPYIAAAPSYSGDWNVPNGYLFVLGDNRNDSSDSHAWGFLPIQNVVGKALLIYWPPNEWAMVDHIKIEVPAP